MGERGTFARKLSSIYRELLIKKLECAILVPSALSAALVCTGSRTHCRYSGRFRHLHPWHERASGITKKRIFNRGRSEHKRRSNVDESLSAFSNHKGRLRWRNGSPIAMSEQPRGDERSLGRSIGLFTPRVPTHCTISSAMCKMSALYDQGDFPTHRRRKTENLPAAGDGCASSRHRSPLWPQRRRGAQGRAGTAGNARSRSSVQNGPPTQRSS